MNLLYLTRTNQVCSREGEEEEEGRGEEEGRRGMLDVEVLDDIHGLGGWT